MKMPAVKFKAKCLSLMDHVNMSHEEIIIIKHSKAVAKLVPISETPEKPLGNSYADPKRQNCNF